jgi:hypothetical protein
MDVLYLLTCSVELLKVNVRPDSDPFAAMDPRDVCVGQAELS